MKDPIARLREYFPCELLPEFDARVKRRRSGDERMAVNRVAYAHVVYGSPNLAACALMTVDDYELDTGGMNPTVEPRTPFAECAMGLPFSWDVSPREWRTSKI